ncbi:MAG: hypothetical protein ABIQ70_02550 [Dokdonella sp.]
MRFSVASSRKGVPQACRAFTHCLLSAAIPVFAFAPGSAIEPAASGCSNLDDVPVQFTIDYQSAIQGIFDNHCIECHSGDPPLPADLDLSAGGSWSHVFNVLSSQDSAFTRVVPNHPDQSLLFLKVNCDTPGVGHRMPFGGDPLQPEDQALIFDWIAAGAPSTTTDVIFSGGFDVRG